MRIPVIVILAVSILLVIGLFVIDWLCAHGGESENPKIPKEEQNDEKNKSDLHDRSRK